MSYFKLRKLAYSSYPQKSFSIKKTFEAPNSKFSKYAKYGQYGQYQKYGQQGKYGQYGQYGKYLQFDKNRSPEYFKKAKTDQVWSLTDDAYLWNHRDFSVRELSESLERTQLSIRFRLKNLVDVNSCQFQRLFGSKNDYDQKYHVYQSNDFEVNKVNAEPRPGKNFGEQWSKSDDEILWNNRDRPINVLSKYFQRTSQGIMYRLQYLRQLTPSKNSSIPEVVINENQKNEEYQQLTTSKDVDIDDNYYANDEIDEDDIDEDDIDEDDENYYANDELVGNDIDDINENDENYYENENENENDENDENDEKYENNNDLDQSVPKEFCDPITLEIMKEPMIATVSGQTYEKEVIEEYIKQKNRDPITMMPLSLQELIPNTALKKIIEAWTAKQSKKH